MNRIAAALVAAFLFVPLAYADSPTDPPATAPTTTAPASATSLLKKIVNLLAGTLTVSGSVTVPLPSGAATVAAQTGGSQKTQIVDGSGNVIASTSNNLDVQCANCSAGVSVPDESSFTAGVSVVGPIGGVFQTTATSNPLTNGQQGMAQMTANRALFANLRNASGVEIGTSTTPVQVSVANTGANGTAIKVDGSSVTQPISAASLPLPTGAATNSELLIINTTLGSPFQAGGSIGNTAFGATQSGTWNITNIGGTVSLPTGAATSAKQPALGVAGTPSLDVLTVQGAASMTALKVDGSAVTQPVSAASLPLPTGAATSANQSTEITDLGSIVTNTTGVSTAALQTTGNTSAATTATNTGTTATNTGTTATNTGTAATGIGAPADTAYAGSGSASIIAALKGVYNHLGAVVLSAGTNIVGKFGIDQTTPGTTNAVALPSGSVAFGAIVDGGDVTQGTKGDSACASTTTSCTIQSLIRLLINDVNGPIVAGSNIIGATTPQASATGGASGGHFLSAASNNATIVKASAGTLYDITIVQTTTTLGDLRLYDVATGPTCSSATGVVKNFAVQSNAVSPGMHIPFGPTGMNFANGIGICLTGAVADNDNTNFVTGVQVDYDFK